MSVTVPDTFLPAGDKFGDFSHLQKASEESQARFERIMVGEEIPAFSSPEQHSIEKAKTLYQKYQAIDNNSERASELYDEVKEFVLRDLIFERLWYEQQIQDIVAKDGLHRNKMLTLELKEMTSLIEFFEKLLGDICRKYGFDDTKKRDKYRQEKQERLGLKKRTQVVATVPSFDVPVVAPSRGQGIAVVGGRVSQLAMQALARVSTFGINWRKLEEQIGAFFSELDQEMKKLLGDELQVSYLQEYHYRNNEVQRIFKNVLKSYHFSGGFSIEMQDDVVINNLSARDTDDVAETRISLFLSCTLPRDIPEWIIDVLDGGILREENIIARYSSNPTSNLLKDPKDEALFRVRASEIGAQYPQVCKQVSKLKSHPATEFLYYHFQSVYKSGSRDFKLLEDLILAIEYMYSQRKYIYKLIKYIGLENFKREFSESDCQLEQVVQFLEQLTHKYFPIPKGVTRGHVLQENLQDEIGDRIVVYSAEKSISKCRYVFFDKNVWANLNIIGYDGYNESTQTIEGAIVVHYSSGKILKDEKRGEILRGALHDIQKREYDVGGFFTDVDKYIKSQLSSQYKTQREAGPYPVERSIVITPKDPNVGWEQVRIGEVNGRFRVEAEKQRIVKDSLEKKITIYEEDEKFKHVAVSLFQDILKNYQNY